MQKMDVSEIMSGQRLMTGMGYLLGGVGLFGIGKLLVVPHTFTNGLILFGVCSVSLYFAWSVISEGPRLKRIFAEREEANEQQRLVRQDQKNRYRQHAIETVAIANRLTETKFDQESGQRVVTIPADEAAVMTRVLSQASNRFSDLAEED